MTPHAAFAPKHGDTLMICEHIVKERTAMEAMGKKFTFAFVKNPPPQMFPDLAEAQWVVVCPSCAASQKAPTCVRTTWKHDHPVVEQRRIYG